MVQGLIFDITGNEKKGVAKLPEMSYNKKT